MRALTPAGSHPPQVSPLTPLCRPEHPVPNHVVRPPVALSVASAPSVFQASPDEQARHNTPPKRVRHPTDCPFASGCSPPRLAATQLPSITEPATSPARTYTVLTKRPHGRTHGRACPGHRRRYLLQAQRIAYSVAAIDQAFTQTSPQVYSNSTTSQQLLAGGQTRWQNSLTRFQDVTVVQAAAEQKVRDSTRTQISALISASQSATGALQTVH